MLKWNRLTRHQCFATHWFWQENCCQDAPFSYSSGDILINFRLVVFGNTTVRQQLLQEWNKTTNLPAISLVTEPLWKRSCVRLVKSILLEFLLSKQFSSRWALKPAVISSKDTHALFLVSVPSSAGHFPSRTVWQAIRQKIADHASFWTEANRRRLNQVSTNMTENLFCKGSFCCGVTRNGWK